VVRVFVVEAERRIWIGSGTLANESAEIGMRMKLRKNNRTRCRVGSAGLIKNQQPPPYQLQLIEAEKEPEANRGRTVPKRQGPRLG
jgi:hypothetical protein